MSDAYNRLILEASERLAAAVREAAQCGGASQVFVWAIYTTAEEDGRLHIGRDYPEGVDISRIELIRPPQAYRDWGWVPFSAQRSCLHETCRRAPLLPLERRPCPPTS